MLSIQKTSNTEFKREYLYTMTFDPTLINRVNTALHRVGFKWNGKNSLDIDYLNKDVVFPDKKAETETFFWKGKTHYITKNPNTSGEGDFSFMDDTNNIAEAVLTVLFNESVFLEDSYTYIGDVYIEEYDIDKKTVCRKAELLSCHLTEVKHGNRRKESSDISYITTHITWDDSIVYSYIRG